MHLRIMIAYEVTTRPKHTCLLSLELLSCKMLEDERFKAEKIGGYKA